MMNGNLKVHEQCQMQAAWGEIWTKFKAFDKHVEEGEGKGGHRDRLASVEKDMQTIKEEKLNTTKAAQWRIGIIVGVMCSLPAWISLMMRLFGK